METLATVLTFVVLPLSALMVLSLTWCCVERDRFPLYVVAGAMVVMAMISALYL
jgi:hypothetical protein